MTKEDAWKHYYESNPELFDGGLSENDLVKVQEAFYAGFDINESIKESLVTTTQKLAIEHRKLNQAKELIGNQRDFIYDKFYALCGDEDMDKRANLITTADNFLQENFND